MKMRLLTLTLLLTSLTSVQAEEWKQVVSLRGEWKFSLGDESAWASPAFQDDAWTSIRVPGNWENQGFEGYDGYAWYRVKVTIPDRKSTRPLYLHLGYIDDASEVFLNGILIGKSGEFPPGFNSSFNNFQRYYIHPEMLRPGQEQVIAIRVYDGALSGGISHGRIGIFELNDAPELNVNMAGRWKFTPGDSPDYRDEFYDEGSWTSVWVPSAWETQGFRAYDGFGWYRIRFKVPEYLLDQPLVLLLGKIDDVDEAWVNGCFVGRTGRLGPGSDFYHEYRELRAYLMPPGTFTAGVNVLAVRVYDNLLNGGIYEGPIGLISLDRYRNWEKKQRTSDTPVEYLPANN